MFFGKEDFSDLLRSLRRGSGDERGADSAAVAGEADAHKADGILARGGGVRACVGVCDYVCV